MSKESKAVPTIDILEFSLSMVSATQAAGKLCEVLEAIGNNKNTKEANNV